VLESHVLRSVRQTTTSSIANSFGLALSASAGFAAGPADPDTGIEPIGGSVTSQLGTSRGVTHALTAGSGARTSHSLRTNKPLLPVHAKTAFHVTLVRPNRGEARPAPGTPLDTGTT
jgi:hypothetical protein